MNDVKWSPSGDAIASASDDSTIRIFDLRADSELGCLQKDFVLFACESLDFSVRLENISVDTVSERDFPPLFSDVWSLNTWWL